MAGLERGAVYVPGFRRDGRAVGGPDEDAFTMAATALEGLATVSARLPPPISVHLVGTFPPVVEWGFAALLGHPVGVVPHPPGIAGLRETLAALSAAGASGPALLVAVDLPDRPEGGPSAVALRFGSTGGSAGIPPLSGQGVAGVVRDLLRGLPSSAVAESTTPVRLAPPAEARARAWVEAPLGGLSEGAYVPRARYLENLPSRWRLEGQRCGRCGSLTFPARNRCRSCGIEESLTVETLPRDGAWVVAVTTIGKGGQPTEFDAQVDALGEYSVVLAEFAPGVRLTLQVADAAPGEIGIDARIGTRLRRLYPMEGEWRYGRKAVPLPDSPVPSTGS
ncbi:MAG TPA: zinc ribbon domain-containing protein [Thermoplasmata archaeon]|nr:zinc ribbon domain-containing protein [Thermoplasmata archaeon]